jgi:hypothetical protein
MPLVHRRLPWLCLAGLAACSSVEPDAEDSEHYIEGFVQLQYEKPHNVDILIVLDNSSSMAQEQALLANNLAPLIDVLEHDSVEADYRIAITTTDAGHPACASGTPEGGAFVLTPCTSRLDEFVADGEGGASDVRALACEDICGLDAAELEILPTTTDEDPVPRPRPWLEFIDGRTNLPEGVSMADALSCFAPQGIAGCDFEMPLESMYQALLRAKDASDPAYGFLRKDAKLVVVIVTDEDDCSPAPGAEEIFSAEGATSAACWNAGVTCVGDPSGYDSCEATDVDAVLRPLSRYVELFDELMIDKLAIDSTQRPLISILAGVGPNGDPVFAEVGDSDPEFQQTFGIGPSCEADGEDPDRPIRATPPVRLLAMQAALDARAVFSVCESDWTPVLEPIAERIYDGIRPACFTYCALDTDAATFEIEPDCIVHEEFADGSIRHIEECARDENGYSIDPETHDFRMPSDDVHVCHAQLTDDFGLTPDLGDDMSPECTDLDYNLEFKIARRVGHPAKAGTRVTATCSLSAHPSISCPGLD